MTYIKTSSIAMCGLLALGWASLPKIATTAERPLSSSALVQQPARPDWPQPIMRGTVVIAGSAHPSEANRKAFAKFIPANMTFFVIYSERDPAAVRAEWKSAFDGQILVVTARASETSAEALSGSKAVWVDLEDAPSEPIRTKMAAMLKAVRDKGGVVGGPMWLGEKVVADQATAGIGLIESSVLSLQGHGSFPPKGKEAEVKPGMVGIGLEETGAAVFRGRKLFSIDEQTVHWGGALRAGERRYWHELGGFVDNGPQTVDYIALRRRSMLAGMPAYPPDPMREPRVEKGTLFIVGGGGNPEGLMARFIEACGGPDAPIVYVPCEERETVTNADAELEMFRRAGAKSVSWVHTKDRNRANTDEAILKPLRKAKGVWFGGGRQWNLADSYQDTVAHDLMRQVLERGGAIGGSSAGASIQSDYMPRGDPLGNLNIIAPGYEQGLGFLPGCGVDQHFTQRMRHPDMVQLTTKYPQLLGIGLDESTAIIVKGSRAEVFGRGNVQFYDKRRGIHDTLANGQTYDLVERKVVP